MMRDGPIQRSIAMHLLPNIQEAILIWVHCARLPRLTANQSILMPCRRISSIENEPISLQPLGWPLAVYHLRPHNS